MWNILYTLNLLGSPTPTPTPTAAVDAVAPRAARLVLIAAPDAGLAEVDPYSARVITP